MATPADVVAAAVEVVNEWHAAAEASGSAPSVEWAE